MFERFAHAGRQVVILAQDEARQRGCERIHSEHLLLGVSRVPNTPGAALLSDLSTSDIEDALGDGAAPAERDALAAVGIDLEEVRRHVEHTFGAGALDNTAARRRKTQRRRSHLPFGGDAKKVLELTLREAVWLRHRTIGTEHVVLGLLHTEIGRAHTILATHGFTLDEMRSAVAGLDQGAASG